ncbi:hypothetical protein WJX75_001691 [Coccomyxa subellipsoidea]|uniref:Cyclic nucleotide-binding domain-containing protein n=1 Tax=Coccomyxa subellipsoidea TaxID=248742 RepID=A0ABR2YJA0_9CHLO
MSSSAGSMVDVSQGVLADADSVNHNKRLYRKETLLREVQRFHLEEILPGKAFGELTHPCYTSKAFRTIITSTASHQVMAVWWRDNQLHGLVRTTCTSSRLI